MEAIDLLLTRRSISAKDMTGPGPSEAELKTLLTAGTRVPDHGKIGPWRIQVLREAGQKALGEVLAKRFAAQHGAAANEKMIQFERERPARAPLLLVVTARLQPEHKVPLMEQKLSGGALCMNLLNAAHALGYVAQWLTEWPAFDAEVKAALGHAPETDIIGFIYVGKPAVPPMERERPGLDTVVSEWTGPAT